MHFHLPRRFRRPLLFPPGLLALAGLLWLGCVVVQSWRERLTKRSVVALTMPSKPTSDTIYSIVYSDGFRPIPFLYSQLYNLYRWQNIPLNGNAASDSAAALAISKTIEKMRADTIPNCGIRVRLTPQVRYKTFVRLLDLMQLNNQKKYLFDIYHGPATLYVLVDNYTPQRPPEPFFSCGTNSYTKPLLPTVEQEVSSWGLLLQPSEWRVLLWLLAVMAVLSTWRIMQAWHKV